MEKSILKSKALAMLKEEGFALSYLESEKILIVKSDAEINEFSEAARPLIEFLIKMEKQYPCQNLAIVVDKNTAKLYQSKMSTAIEFNQE